MNVTNAVYKAIAIRWNAVTLPLKAGSPISLAGLVANDENAVGLVPQTITQKPLIETVRVLVAGDVELAEVEASFGEELTTDALSAMSGIRFFGEDGTPVPDYLRTDEQYNLPPASTEERGGVKMATPVETVPTGESADAEANADAINALIAALKVSGIMQGIEITQQPQDTAVAVNTAFEIPMTATGDGLTYKWHYKNQGDPWHVSGITTASYTGKITKSSLFPRLIYCDITDASGATVTTRIATISKA